MRVPHCIRRVSPLAVVASSLLFPALASASEAKLKIPDQFRDASAVPFTFGLSGQHLLMTGLVVCVLGLLFGVAVYAQLKKMPVHRSMLEISELIYATCKTYLVTQGKFLMVLWVFITVAIVGYFGFLAEYPITDDAGNAVMMNGVEQMAHGFPAWKVAVIVAFSLVGMAGSVAVAWFGIRVNTFANSRTAHASLAGKGYPCYAIPLKAGMSIGMVLISVELLIMLAILCFLPGSLAGPCFIGFAIGESLGAAALRVAGGIFTKIADIGSDLMKIVFKIKEDDARNPGVIADCVGDNAGDSVGPSADGFETYGVTGVALITFILLAISPTYLATHLAGMSPEQAAVAAPTLQVQLLVWIFVMRVLMVITSAAAYFINEAIAKARYSNVKSFNYEVPLTSLVWIASILSIVATYAVSYLIIPELVGNPNLWWKLATIITCGTLAGAVIPEVVKVFTSVHSRHVREVVQASEEGGASLNILSGLTAGNFSAFWLGGITISGLMAGAYFITLIGVAADGTAGTSLGSIMPASAIFAFGLVAFGFLGMGPVTIAVDSYGPVTDNAQSVYELSLIENEPNIHVELQRDFGINADFPVAKELLEENDGAGNTFKATAKPVLIGTAVVGSTTMVFSIIMLLTDGLAQTPAGIAAVGKLSILHAPFLLGMIVGAGVIYWFSGASCQAVITGAYRAVEYIKKNMKLDGVTKASTEDSKKVVAICTRYAQAGMFNIFLTMFFMTLATAFIDPFFFIGFLIAVSIVGLFQAVFMANAGGAWDNAKKIVETDKSYKAAGKGKGSALHDATVVGDTVGDPFKDTSSVALNPIIKFSTLFGLLAVELALTLQGDKSNLRIGLAIVFFLIALFFVYRSFYGMRIKSGAAA
jgi:K(+)-stimulated pyrophosphate-energized sodium pump